MASRPPIAGRRRAVAPGRLAEPRGTPPGTTLPLVVEATAADVDLIAWATGERDRIDGWLHSHGAVLFRGFAADLARPAPVVTALAGPPEEYHERSTPRTELGERIYTSTDHPPDQPILLHNENSYQHEFPRRLVLCCRRAAPRGGATPLADCRRVLARIPEPVVERFARRGVMYVRTFGTGLGLDWRTAFATADRAEVERYCAGAGILCEWTADGGLRTRQVRPALARHPVTGERVWFNHAAFFHVSSLPPDVAAALTAQLGEDRLPTDARYGDGEPIEPAALDAIRAAYAAEASPVAWRAGDVLLVDNLLAAHGREPFAGPREVVVGMALPATHDDVRA